MPKKFSQIASHYGEFLGAFNQGTFVSGQSGYAKITVDTFQGAQTMDKLGGVCTGLSAAFALFTHNYGFGVGKAEFFKFFDFYVKTKSGATLVAVIQAMMDLLQKEEGKPQRSMPDAAKILSKRLIEHWNSCTVYPINERHVVEKIIGLYKEFKNNLPN